jgi:hypothetical protein
MRARKDSLSAWREARGVKNDLHGTDPLPVPGGVGAGVAAGMRALTGMSCLAAASARAT